MVGRVVDEPSLRGRLRVFRDRVHAGSMLGEGLMKYSDGRTVVLAIPSGGVPVGRVVADKLTADFDLIVVRKVQVPWDPEAGFGAVAWDGGVQLNESLVSALGLNPSQVETCVEKTREEVLRRMRRFRGDKPMPVLKGRVVILVDDGLASGYTMLVAAGSVKKYAPAKVVVAAPTASQSALDMVARYVDEVVCLNVRGGTFYAVADAYVEWHDLSDGEVMT